MPALEMAQETGKLVAWLKNEGEQVKKGEMLLEVETDKAVVEIEAQSDGILGGVTARTGDVIPVGQTIAWLLKPGESVPQQGTHVQTGRTGAAAAPAAAAAGASAEPAAAEPASAAGARISPKARRLAREHGVDIGTIKGSGPGGEILADDILKAASAGTAAPTLGSTVAPTGVNPIAPTGGSAVAPTGASTVAPASGSVIAPASDRPIAPDALSSIGRIMAERTTQSWTTVPHFFVSRDVDATALNAARTALVPVIERSHSVKVTHTDLLVAAVARALRQHPRMNASWSNGSITLNQEINVALAMAVENAVVTAVIKGADHAAIGDIAKQRNQLAERARANRLQPADISGATFTISNLGMFSVDAFTAIIVPPQAGILAVGAIADRVVAVDGMLGVRPMVNLTLSSDHRVIDGAGAARFLADVVAAVKQAGELR
jgi:pyruvate dehydrogenase E2 component (dihydrolipoamide acetyltransferase)